MNIKVIIRMVKKKVKVLSSSPMETFILENSMMARCTVSPYSLNQIMVANVMVSGAMENV